MQKASFKVESTSKSEPITDSAIVEKLTSKLANRLDAVELVDTRWARAPIGPLSGYPGLARPLLSFLVRNWI